jgi:hypothetical protein
MILWGFAFFQGLRFVGEGCGVRFGWRKARGGGNKRRGLRVEGYGGEGLGFTVYGLGLRVHSYV